MSRPVESAKTEPLADPLERAALKAWLAHVKGSWSESDWKIYLVGYQAGWFERGRAIAEAMEEGNNETAKSI